MVYDNLDACELPIRRHLDSRIDCFKIVRSRGIYAPAIWTGIIMLGFSLPQENPHVRQALHLFRGMAAFYLRKSLLTSCIRLYARYR